MNAEKVEEDQPCDACKNAQHYRCTVVMCPCTHCRRRNARRA